MIRRTLAAVCFAILPTALAAQHRRPSVHLDVGGGPSGGGGYTNSGGLLGRVGGSLPLGPNVDFAVDASIFGSLVSTACLASTPVSCPPGFPVVRSAVGSLVFPVTNRDDYHQITASVGGGLFRFSSNQIRGFTRFGAELGAEMILARQSHAIYTLGARADLITETPRGQTWLLPITAGVRF